MTNATQDDLAWDAVLSRQSNDQDFVIPTNDRGAYIHGGEILNDGSDGGAPQRISELRYKGYVEVWDTKTGVMSLQPQNLLWQTRQKRHEDGSIAFTMTNPHIPPDYGEDLTCPLSPDAPKDPFFSKMGFRACNKGRGKHHIPNQAALDSHLQHSHKRAYIAIKEAKLERQREEDRELQRAALESNNRLMGTLLTNAARTPAAPRVRRPKKT